MGCAMEHCRGRPNRGLADTVIDANDAAMVTRAATGFQFAPVTRAALGAAINRVCDAYLNRRAWRAMVRRAMNHPVGWGRSARAYVALYQSAIDHRAQ